MSQQYTNELIPDVLTCQDISPFRTEQLAEISDEARALIGSHLDNGDEIVSTPQGHSWLVRREGVSMCQSFLAEEA
ncbi:hypothetical protein AHX51_11360 [Salmonella enterica subsp. diarizonae]|nr:hypothetical protein [Salmonella enterica subsp. diarizonae]